MLKTNIQLFADGDPVGYANYLNSANIDTTAMATTDSVGAHYTGTSGTDLANLTAEMKEFYSQYLIKDVGPNLVHAQFLETEKLPRNHGRTIEWRKWSNFSKKKDPLTEGVTPNPSKISATPIRATLDQYGDWSLLTDLVQLQTIDNTLVEFTEKHSENAKLTLDTITRDKMIAGIDESNKVFAGGVETIAEIKDTITPADVARLTAYLRQNNAPTFDGSYVMIIHPYIAYDLMTNKDWIDVVRYTDSTPVFKGELGKLYGIRFVESTESKVTKAKKIANGTAGGTGIKVLSYNNTTHVATVAANTFVADELNSARVMVHDVSDTTKTTIAEMTVSDTGTDSITFSAEASFTIEAGDIIYSGDSALDGKDYFTCLVLGKGAGKKVDIDGNTAEIIVKPVGSAGSTDALNQRGSIGWKVNGYTAAITNGAYIFKYYCVSKLDGAKDNA